MKNFVVVSFNPPKQKGMERIEGFCSNMEQVRDIINDNTESCKDRTIAVYEIVKVYQPIKKLKEISTHYEVGDCFV